jgi:tetratricopeptide (TPR) repeat protein
MHAKNHTIRLFRIVGLTIASLILAPPSARAAFNFPDPSPLAPLEARMLADPSAGNFQQFSLIEAALIASGVDQVSKLESYERKYAAWLAAVRRLSRSKESSLRRAEVLFEFMHREILSGGYDAQATELIHPFDDGRFNCASATVLFTALAADCGLIVHPIERPRHAMCAVEIDGQPMVIETTCPNWFQLTSEMRREAERAALVRDAASDHPASRREIGAAALAAVIYYNRGVDLLHENRFAEAVSVNVRALRLDPENETAAGNLLASINNWALGLCAEGEYAEAAELLARGLAIAPDHEPFHTNQRHVYRSWIQSLAAAGRQREAIAVLDAARRADPGSLIWNYWSQRLGM